MRRLRASTCAALAVAAVTTVTLGAQRDEHRGQPPARQRPAEGFACNPNDLTTYTGVVSAYRRESGQTSITIRTDWDTTEQVTLRHPGSDDPSVFFRIDGRDFRPADWARIEARTGVLRPGTRAAAWVCAGGRTMIEWGVRKE